MGKASNKHRQTAEWSVRIESAARKFIEAHDALRQARSPRSTETLKETQETLSCLKTLVAVCELYQREVPAARDEVEDLIRQLEERRGT